MRRSRNIFSRSGGAAYIVATGGTITRDGDYVVHTFDAGSYNLVVSSNPQGLPLTYLVAAAGGAGGGTNNGGAAGGGGGDAVTGTFIPTVRSYAAVVGVGGLNQGVDSGLNGNNTTFETEAGLLTLLGGGGGGNGQGISFEGDGKDGGSGGGMGYNRPTLTGLATGLGHNGGTYISGDGGCGGGGMGSAGVDGTTAIGSNGGTGLLSSISGLPKYYGCGGGGGSFVSASGGLGGNATGGNGGYGTGNVDVPPTNPTANSGSGGGGAGNSGGASTRLGTNGADGCVIVRYYSPSLVTSFNYETVLTNA